MAKYSWMNLRDFRKKPIDGEYGDNIFIRLPELDIIHSTYHEDEDMNPLWQEETPLGMNSHQKGDIVRFLHWLLFFRTYQRAATNAIKNNLFKGVKDKLQDPWYFIVGEHDQMTSLCIEYSKKSGIITQNKFSVDPKENLYDNIELLVANGQIEKTCETFWNWFKGLDEFTRYAKMVEEIDFSVLEQRVEKELFEQMKMIDQFTDLAGGISLEWGHSGASLGFNFNYRILLENSED